MLGTSSHALAHRLWCYLWRWGKCRWDDTPQWYTLSHLHKIADSTIKLHSCCAMEEEITQPAVHLSEMPLTRTQIAAQKDTSTGSWPASLAIPNSARQDWNSCKSRRMLMPGITYVVFTLFLHDTLSFLTKIPILLTFCLQISTSSSNVPEYGTCNSFATDTCSTDGVGLKSFTFIEQSLGCFLTNKADLRPCISYCVVLPTINRHAHLGTTTVFLKELFSFNCVLHGVTPTRYCCGGHLFIGLSRLICPGCLQPRPMARPSLVNGNFSLVPVTSPVVLAFRTSSPTTLESCYRLRSCCCIRWSWVTTWSEPTLTWRDL